MTRGGFVVALLRRWMMRLTADAEYGGTLEGRAAGAVC